MRTRLIQMAMIAAYVNPVDPLRNCTLVNTNVAYR